MYIVDNLKITHSITNQTIIDDFSISMNYGDKIAIIGEEGSGKSTLIKFFAHQTLSYADVSFKARSTSLVVTFIAQERMQADMNIQTFLFNHNYDIDYKRLYHLLSGFGLEDDILDRLELNSLSGGEYTKLSIIKALMNPFDLLILDEPTNNLDLKSIKFLEAELLKIDRPLVFASHDRAFIKNVGNAILHLEQLERRHVTKHTFMRTDYQSYVKHINKTIENHNQLAKTEKQEYKVAKDKYYRMFNKLSHASDHVSKVERDFVASKIKAKMNTVKTREKQLEISKNNLTKTIEPESAAIFKLNSIFTPANKEIVRLDLARLSIGDKVLVENLKLDIIGPKKIAIIGDNGVGKTTLIKTLLKACLVDFAYMPQSYHDVLDTEKTPIELLQREGTRQEITDIMTHLGSLNFRSNEMEEQFKNLSGGQKAKTFFAMMSLLETQLLVMDEPTRNISPLSLDTLIQEINDYKGSVLIITHNRDLLSQTFDEIYELTPKGLHLIEREALI